MTESGGAEPLRGILKPAPPPHMAYGVGGAVLGLVSIQLAFTKGDWTR